MDVESMGLDKSHIGVGAAVAAGISCIVTVSAQIRLLVNFVDDAKTGLLLRR